jgi:hypothetical protein
MVRTAASISRIVHVVVDPATNGGCDIATGVVSRVWGACVGPDGLDRQTVNVRVLGDSDEVCRLTSISLFDDRPTEEQLAAMNPHNPKGYNAVAFWPERV